MIFIPFENILDEFWNELWPKHGKKEFEEYVQLLNKLHNIRIIYRYSLSFGYSVKGIEIDNKEDATAFKLRWAR